MTLLRSTTLHLTSRERLARSMSQWVHFLFLPESLNNEIRGTGLLGWAGDNVLPHLVQQQPGTVQVRGEQQGGKPGRGWQGRGCCGMQAGPGELWTVATASSVTFLLNPWTTNETPTPALNGIT